MLPENSSELTFRMCMRE